MRISDWSSDVCSSDLMRIGDDFNEIGPILKEDPVRNPLPRLQEQIIGTRVVGKYFVLDEPVDMPSQANHLGTVVGQYHACCWVPSGRLHVLYGAMIRSQKGVQGIFETALEP